MVPLSLSALVVINISPVYDCHLSQSGRHDQRELASMAAAAVLLKDPLARFLLFFRFFLSLLLFVFGISLPPSPKATNPMALA